jgi:protein-L-isoaspartate(D-aspartate) O-methyltransferase
MIDTIRDEYGLKDFRVLSAMASVDRAFFVSKKFENIAYEDKPIDIGYGQTISQPYTVALMTHLLLSDKKQVPSDKLNTWRVLEIGTGSGYQAAVLSRLVKEVYSVEIIPELAKQAKKNLKSAAVNNVSVKVGTGEAGWNEHAPFDAIMVTAGMESVPEKLFDQLNVGGVLVAPVGKGMDKQMTRITKTEGIKYSDLKNPTSPRLRVAREEFGIFHFVPFVEK